MQKIMFNDHFGLTQAVLEGRKTMTRRFGYKVWVNNDGSIYEHSESRYKIGEVVAVAQSYNDIYEELKRTHGSSSSVTRDFFHEYIQGGRMPVSNKMFVKSEAMLHQIRITDIKVERLQDISDEDTLREGVIAFDCVTHEYVGKCYSFYGDKNKLGIFITPREAFSALIDKVSGKGTWAENQWCLAYTFELVK